MNDILQRIKDVLESRDLKPSVVQRACNIKPSTWSLWYRNDTLPKTNDLIAIINYLKLDANWLLGIKQPEPKSNLSLGERTVLKAVKDFTDNDILRVIDFCNDVETEHYLSDHAEEMDKVQKDMYSEIDSLIPNREEGEF